jgi:hypothetical protein
MKAEPRSPSRSSWRRLTRGLTPAILIPVFLAFISFVYTTLDYSRKERLESVRAQVVKLYGPLAALTDTTEQLWEAVSKPNGEADLADNRKLNIWRNFLREVIVPLSNRIEETLLTSGQVIHCEEISKGLHQFRSFAAFVKLAVLTWNAENTWNAEDKVIDRTMTGNGIDYDHAYPAGLAKALAANRDKLKERERILDNPVMGLIYYPNLEAPCSALNSPATSVASQGGR